MPEQSPAAQERAAEFEAVKARMEAEGFVSEKRTISMGRANVYSLLLFIPFVVLVAGVYALVRGFNFTDMDISSTFINLFILWLVLIFVHEGLHGLTWGLFCKSGFKSIRFGFMLKSITPYCNCKEPLSQGAYIWGALMPLLILGFGFFAAALILNSQMLLFLSILNAVGASGDVLIVSMALKCRHALIIDHPSECGFVAFKK